MVSRIKLLIFASALVISVATACVSDSSDPTETSVIMVDLTNVSIEVEQHSPTELQAQTPDATNTLQPSPVPTDTMNSVAEVDSTTETQVNTSTPRCKDQAELVRHLNVSNNTEFKPDTYFAKVWLIKNTGTCIWSADYKLIYHNGDLMGAPNEVSFPHEVLPGEMVELRVNLVAPTEPSTYNNQWMLRSNNGEVFGIGSSSNEPLQVKIVVVAPHIPIRG